MDIWTDEHSRVVAEAAPPIEGVDLASTWATVRARMDTKPPRRSRKTRMLIGAGVTAAIVSVSGVAAAGIFSAHTGTYPSDAEDLRLGGPGERLDPAGPDFRQAIEDATKDISFPTETARRISIESHVRDAEGDNPTPHTEAVSTGAIRGWTAVHAVCSWANEWVKSRRAGDDATTAQAASMLEGARHWSAITDLDPVQKNGTLTQQVFDPDTGVTKTETLADPTQFYYLRLVSDAVEAGDVKALGSTLAANAYCIGPSLVPDFLQALPEGFRGR